jgi:dihydrofolate reductase
MPKVSVYNSISLDGYFTDARGDMSWAHQRDPEWTAFAARNSQGSGQVTFLFGRVTYQLMASFWPTPQGRESAPEVADNMNARAKLVFSRTLREASWANTTILKGDPVSEVRKLKQQPGTDLMIFGSGTIVARLAEAGLIDEYKLVVTPVVLGAGRTLFEGVKQKLLLKRTSTRSFENGNVFVCYEPAR